MPRVPTMAGIAPPRQIVATPAGMAGRPTGPAMPIQRETVPTQPGLPGPQEPDYRALAKPLPGLTAAQVKHFHKAFPKMPLPRVAVNAAVSNEWAKLAEQLGVLTGDRGNDDILWEQHIRYLKGQVPTDPLLAKYPDAAQKIAERAEQILKQHLAARASERMRGPQIPRGMNAQRI